MKLKYKILWFEDDEDVIEQTSGPAVREFLKSLGFEPDITHHLNGTSLKAIMDSKLCNSYDLIITDLNLGEDAATGAEIIAYIRQGLIFTDVLLYSANSTQIQAITEENGWVERASYCVGLANLTDKIRNLIKLTVKKQQDVNNARGLVIAETIVLEKKIERIILGYFEATEGTILDNDKITLLDRVRQKKLVQHQQHADILNKIGPVNVKELIDNDILTAGNSAEALVSVLKKNLKLINTELNSAGLDLSRKELLLQRQQETKELKEELINFQKEVLKIRNTLAHVEENIDADGTPYLESLNADGTTIKFDANKYVEIRRDLHKHGANLDKILTHLLL